jgi:membrane protein implicated in regulation of membrane protease activity
MFTPMLINQSLAVAGLSFILLTLFIGIEVGIDFLLIGSILLISGFVGIATGSYVVALILASILAVLYVLYGRSFVKQKLIVRTKATNIDKLLGQSGKALSDISPDKTGSIKVDDEEWRAQSTDTIKQGEPVAITGIQGVTVLVKKA